MSSPTPDQTAEGQDAENQDAENQSGGPLRVTTLELFFDLVFAFTLTQLATVLDHDLTGVGVARVLLVFGPLWWMYSGYAWLTNTRPPVHTAERLPLLAGMAGFLVMGLAIPTAFGRGGLVIGLGYLVVVLVHSVLYYQVNHQIVRFASVNLAGAGLVIAAGAVSGTAAGGAARYPLWAAALVLQLGSPFVVRPGGRFELNPDHLTERHSALLIVALGEAVAAIGIGAASRPGGITLLVIVGSVLGLALAAALWWVIFGTADDERTLRVLSAVPSDRRTGLAITALFWGIAPMLLGLVAMAAGVQQAIARTGPVARSLPWAGALAVGAAVFLAGNAIVRRQLGVGVIRPRLVTAVVALATTAAGATIGLLAQLAVLTAVLLALLIVEPRLDPRVGTGPGGTAG